MIRGVVISNGKLRVVLTADDAIGQEALKALDGATCTIVTDNLRVYDENVAGGLVIELASKRSD